MKKNLLFSLLFAVCTATTLMGQAIVFTPGSANAQSPSSTTTFSASVTASGVGFTTNYDISSATAGTPTPSSVTVSAAVLSHPSSTGFTSADFTVTIPSGLVLNSTITIPVTLVSGGTSYMGTFTITITTVLAAEMTIFNAKSTQGKNVLSWATASEKDNSKFVIEQSTNGVDFKAIGEVKGALTSQVANSYSFTDENPSKTINYYRLKTISLDGAAGTSKVVAVANKGVLNAYVTPAVQGARVSIASDQEGTGTIDILNLNGQIVSSQAVVLTEGLSEHTVTFNQLGMFIVRVGNNKTSVSAKFFKQ